MTLVPPAPVADSPATRPSAFDRLRALLAGIAAPPGLDPAPLHLGELRTDADGPALRRARAALADGDGWSRYPPLGGTPALREAYAGWLGRRFGARARLDRGEVDLEPAPGAKQAVAACLELAVARARAAGDPAPAVLLPDPFYPTYVAASAGAEIVFHHGGTALAEALDAAIRPPAAVVVCHPGNPDGSVVAPGWLRTVGEAAARAGTLLVADECYTDLWVDAPPPGLLGPAAAPSAPGRWVALHSLSKRSGMPGLRSAFVAGDPETVAGYARFNRSCGVSLPGPVCAASAALWADEAHVDARRVRLAENRAAADAVLGGLPGYRRADAGFFVWLPVDDDEAATRALWSRAGVRVMPGRYLSAPDAGGVDPGVGRVRLALVHDPGTLSDALRRARPVLDEHTSGRGAR